MTWISWIPPIVTGVHVVLFGVLTFIGHRHRKKFVVFMQDDRKKWEAARDELVRLLTEGGET